MPRKWTRETHSAWKKSEVAQEYEKLLIRSAVRLGAELKARGQAASTISEKGKQIQDSLSKATESVKTLTDAAKNLSDDQEQEEEFASEEEQKEAKEKLILELKQAAEKAGRSGDIKMAYRIERTISEIIGE